MSFCRIINRKLGALVDILTSKNYFLGVTEFYHAGRAD